MTGFGLGLRELQRAGWQVKVDEQDLTEVLSTGSIAEPRERTFTIEKDGRVAVEFRVINGIFHGDVIADLVADLRRLEAP